MKVTTTLRDNGKVNQIVPIMQDLILDAFSPLFYEGITLTGSPIEDCALDCAAARGRHIYLAVRREKCNFAFHNSTDLTGYD